MDDIDVTISKLTDKILVNYIQRNPLSNDTHMLITAGVKAGLQYAYDDYAGDIKELIQFTTAVLRALDKDKHSLRKLVLKRNKTTAKNN